MQPTQERWLPVPGWEGFYEVSDLGRVRSIDRVIIRSNGHRVPLKGVVLSPESSSTRYLAVHLSGGGRHTVKRVHVLVAAAFIGPRPAGLLICHNDDDGHNNRAANLRYDTNRNNMLDAVALGANRNANKTHCPKGHEYSAENARIYARPGGTPSRYCRACMSERDKARHAVRV